MESNEGNKKARKRPGRHLKQKRRVEQREKMMEERDQERQEREEHECEEFAGSELKIFDKDSPFYSAFTFLEENFPCKIVLRDASAPACVSDHNIQKLSRDVVRLLRWDLPKTGISFSCLDGSAIIGDVANHLRVPVETLMYSTSALVGGKGKMRVLIYERWSSGAKEVRISALGGHGFPVFAPPGHCLIPKPSESCPSAVTPLNHETDKIGPIKKANFLSSMDRAGGINFHPRVSGGYRPRANFDITIDQMQLTRALDDGLDFFENHFSGLVYGMGRWDWQTHWWNGKIPLHYTCINART